MAQYDVLTDLGKSAADGIPCLVVIQSDLCPIVAAKGNRIHALAHYAAPLPAKGLECPIGFMRSGHT